jgi:hypothetical protein
LHCHGGSGIGRILPFVRLSRRLVIGIESVVGWPWRIQPYPATVVRGGGVTSPAPKEVS